MADPVVTLTQTRFPRDELAELTRRNPRMVKAFEALFMDVGKTLPDAIASATTDADSILGQSIFAPPARQPIPAAAPNASQILAASSFAHPQPPARPVVDVSELILAAQIFGA